MAIVRGAEFQIKRRRGGALKRQKNGIFLKCRFFAVRYPVAFNLRKLGEMNG